MEACPHCGGEIPEDCHPERTPDCWDLRMASASEHVQTFVWVTKGEKTPEAVESLMRTLDEVEHAPH